MPPPMTSSAGHARVCSHPDGSTAPRRNGDPADRRRRAPGRAGFAPLTRYLRDGGVDGLFCCGTTGEGVLLTPRERRRAAELFRSACDGRLFVHAGAQTTRDTVALAEHAREIGADGVAVIPPPYFPLTDDALVEHLCAAAQACAPVEFYLYAFTARSGYPVPIAVVERVRERAPTWRG